MSAQIKIGAAIALIAGGAWWFWSQPTAARTPRSPADLPRPPAEAARSTSPLETAKTLEAPQTAADLEAQQAEQERRSLGPGGGEEQEPSLGLVDVPYVPRPPIAPLPPRPAQPGKIAGTIVDENGEPIQARTMLVGGEGGSYGGGKTGEAGEYDLERQGYETFQVKAWTDDGRVGVFDRRDIDASLGVSDATIRLERGARVHLTLAGDRDRCRIAMFTDNVRHTDFTLRKSGPSSPVVPPGSLYMELYDGGGADKVVYDTRTININPGQDETVEFTVYR